MNTPLLINEDVKSVSVSNVSYRIGDAGFGEDHKGVITRIAIEFLPDLKAMEFIVYVNDNPYIHVPYHAVQVWMER